MIEKQCRRQGTRLTLRWGNGNDRRPELIGSFGSERLAKAAKEISDGIRWSDHSGIKGVGQRRSYVEAVKAAIVEKLGGTEWDRGLALRQHALSGGYLVRSGQGDLWVVMSDLDGLSGWRNTDAYGVDVSEATDEEWARAGWDEAKLDGYDRNRATCAVKSTPQPA